MFPSISRHYTLPFITEPVFSIWREFLGRRVEVAEFGNFWQTVNARKHAFGTERPSPKRQYLLAFSMNRPYGCRTCVEAFWRLPSRPGLLKQRRVTFILTFSVNGSAETNRELLCMLLPSCGLCQLISFDFAHCTLSTSFGIATGHSLDRQ